ncbi:MAG TPA: DNA ligase D [Stellaceae bacterium]|nr:DNA ligase D [Stellaceae bacterium]
MALEEYRRKRRFEKTAEPKGATPRARKKSLSFVVQKHDASRLHYDFRLEYDGVLKSWAVPKGPSLDPADKRLAVQVEDHPVEYGGFEGTIPEGEYGGGTVMLWDRGTWEPVNDPAEGLAKGSLKFVLAGARMKGHWALVQMKGPRGGNGKNWLLIKERDAMARPGHGDDLVERYDRSVESRRTMDGIAKNDGKVWRSKPRRTALQTRGERLLERVAATRVARLDPADIPGARRARLPASPRPELATLADAAPEGDGWLHEIKFDGYRMVARVASGKVRMLSRNGIDWTGRFPRIEAALAALPLEDAVIDGEVVHLEPNGVSSFSGLKDDLSAKRTDHLVYYVFDLPYLDGHSLEGAALEARKEALQAIVPPGGTGPVRLSEHVTGNGARFYQEAGRHGLEGIVSKRSGSLYRSERTHDWLKIKCVKREEFIVLGWTDPEGKRKGLGALLLGYYDRAKNLCFAGAVGTGFTARTLAELRARLDPLAREKPPSAEIARDAPKGAHWVAPKLVAEVQYSEWTEDGRLRHPSYQGLREDKEPDDVIPDRLRAASSSRPSSARASSAPRATPSARNGNEIAGVRLTHPEKILYPEAGITKLDLAQYYVAVADAMLPHVKGRPLTLLRSPDGVGGKHFYQKHPGDSAPDALGRIEIDEKEGRTIYLLADDVAGLVALVQMGVLEIHLWGSTKRAIEKPDRIIFDLDPDEGLAWDHVVEGAIRVRDLLAEMGLETWPKTTGGKGLHVVLPVRPHFEWDAIKAFSHAVADELVRRHPDAYTGTLSKRARHGRIFIDYLRNQRGATAIAPFSARAKPQAPVAMPLTWREVEAGVRADAFTVRTAPERLKKLRRDPWEGLLECRQSLPAAVMRKFR